MKLEEFRKYFDQLEPGKIFYARPIFNDEFMSKLNEILGEDKYEKFEHLIKEDDSIGLKYFFKNNYPLNNGHNNLKMYKKSVSMDFDILLEPNVEAEHPYHLGFYSDSISLEKVIELLRVYFDNEKSSHWLTGVITKDSIPNANEDIVKINGNLILVASPASTKETTLGFCKETTDIKDKAVLSEIFNQYIDEYNNKLYTNNQPLTEKDISLSVTEINCYNIGQGNCIMLKGLKNEHIYFDIGLTKYENELNQTEIINNIEELKSIPPDIIVLSHWDTDHILGLSLWDNNIYSKKWIVPDIYSLWFNSSNQQRKSVEVSAYAFRVFIELLKSKSNNIFIVSDNLKKTCIYKKSRVKLLPGIEIWTGERKSSSSKKKYSISRANNFGLIMVLCGFYNHAILCGDCDYKIIPPSIKDKLYDCVIVSHHGSNMSPFPFKPGCKKNAVAVVSYGASNTYGHPNQSKLSEIVNSGYQIIRTVGLSKHTVSFPIDNKKNIRTYGI